MNRRQAILRISLAGTAVVGAVAGYKWYDITKKPDLPYLNKNKELIAALAETIIPATTGCPGAKDTGVNEFIILMIKECTERKAQNKFINGIKDLQEYCAYKWGNLYQHCTGEQQAIAMKRFEKKGRPFKGILGKAQNRFLGKSFFTTLKQYTVEGYCTSQAGATQGLAYVFIPGRYEGCISMSPGQKGWATN
jgi:Gluconate 2-dehydrogenase subunit 3